MTKILYGNFDNSFLKCEKRSFGTSPMRIFSCFFLVQFEINLHLWFSQKAEIALLKNSLVQINSKLNSKPYDYLYWWDLKKNKKRAVVKMKFNFPVHCSFVIYIADLGAHDLLKCVRTHTTSNSYTFGVRHFYPVIFGVYVSMTAFGSVHTAPEKLKTAVLHHKRIYCFPFTHATITGHF